MLGNGFDFLAERDEWGDVGGEFYDFDGFSACIANGIIAGLDPDFAATAGDAAVFAGEKLATGELAPEFGVFIGLLKLGIDEDAVVLADDFLELIAHGLAEILVGVEDDAIDGEFDNGLGAGDSLDLVFKFSLAELFVFFCGDVADELDDFDEAAGLVADGVIGALDPDFATALGETAVDADVASTTIQGGPEAAVLVASCIFGGNEHAVVLADNFIEGVADGGEEIGISGKDGTVGRKFDYGMGRKEGFYDRDEFREGFVRSSKKIWHGTLQRGRSARISRV